MNNRKIESIISAYKKLKQQNPDTWLDNSVSQKTLDNAIEVSAKAVNHLNKKHPHQYRIPKTSLDKLSTKLLANKNVIKKVKSFDELYGIIDIIEIYKVGELVKYDTAFSLGAYLGVFPDKIYLHSGTRIGAEILIGKTKEKYITKQQLPEPFQTTDLIEAEIEDILCIYKDELVTCI